MKTTTPTLGTGRERHPADLAVVVPEVGDPGLVEGDEPEEWRRGVVADERQGVGLLLGQVPRQDALGHRPEATTPFSRRSVVS